MQQQAHINKAEKNETLKKWPLYVLLLPVFFVMHGANENFGFILLADYLPLILFYCTAATIIYFILYLLYRQKNKAGLLSFFILSVFFFYGALQDFLKEYFALANRYIILLPVFFLLLVTVAIVLKRSKSGFTKLAFFLNGLLLAYTIYDLSAIIIKTISPPADKFTVYPFAKNNPYNLCDSCDKPDIYFLIFDEYTSSINLKNNFGYDNSELDSFLSGKQFHIQKNSRSNYNFTPFSVASILNMSYINGLTPERITSNDYARCTKLIRENETIKYFSAAGYDIINYSIFDIAGNPSPVDQDFLPLKAKLITSRTLWARVKKDILWNFFTGKFKILGNSQNSEYVYRDNNNKLIELVKKESTKTNGRPRFIYAHYNMPHPPYYFDGKGNEIEKTKLGKKYHENKSLYTGYLGYTNSVIKDLVNAILNNSKGKAAIIIMGDHGFRYDKKIPQDAFFQNQNAVYLPDKNYARFYDSITGINQFKNVINTLFMQHIPLAEDSTVFLTDAK